MDLFIVSFLQGWKPNLSLDSDDIRAVKALYGRQTTVTTKNTNSQNKNKSPKPILKIETNPRNYYYRYKK